MQLLITEIQNISKQHDMTMAILPLPLWFGIAPPRWADVATKVGGTCLYNSIMHDVFPHFSLSFSE